MCRVKPGRIMFRAGRRAPAALAKRAFELAAAKLPVDTRFVTRPRRKEVWE